MRPITKVNNSDLSLRLKLNYNNVYSRLKMLLGKSSCIFADISTKRDSITWYADDDSDYIRLTDAPKEESKAIMSALSRNLNETKRILAQSPELTPYVDDILEIPDNSYVFYRPVDGGYKFVLAGWGCKPAHSGITETGGFIKRVARSAGVDEDTERPDKPGLPKGNNRPENDDILDLSDTTDEKGRSDERQEPAGNIGRNQTKGLLSDNEIHGAESGVTEDTPKKKKTQHVVLKVINQNNKPVEDEDVRIRTQHGESVGVTDDNGLVEVGHLPYHSVFRVSFPNMPNIQERAYEVEPKVENYEAHIKKYIKYSPVLFVEDQAGNVVDNYNIKVVVSGQDSMYNTGSDGMVQLPTMQEGQKFIVIDASNYANSQEYSVNPETVKSPFRFTINRIIKSKVGITVIDKNKKPIEGAIVDILAGTTPCQQVTDKNGRSEFPADILTPGKIDVKLYVPGKGTINSELDFLTDVTEYTIQLTGKKPGRGFNWKWLMLLPLILLLAFGGKYLYDYMHKSGSEDNPTPDHVPTIAEMEKGVCLILGQGFYYVDLKVPDITIDGHPAVAYFNYNDNSGEVTNLTFDPEKAKVQGWWGTGFLISEDGLIATNKHIAAPAVPEKVAVMLKKHFQEQKDYYQENANKLNERLQLLASRQDMSQQYTETRDGLRYCQEQVKNLDKLLNIGDFTVQSKAWTKVAFSNTRVETEDDFIACSMKPRAVGDPGGVAEKDLAIIQIKKPKDIPSDVYIFKVPEVDPLDGQVPDNYEVTVLGYNAGGNLQDMDLQESIKPQAQHGKITNLSEKYRVGYDAPTIGGSSGSPVINNKGELVAINNSGLAQTQGFNYGIRTKYLRELLDGLRKEKKTENSEGSETPENNGKTDK